MAKTYSMQFGVGDPRTYTGLAPTLLIFVNISSGATLVAPALSEALTGSGIYKFAYGTTTPIAFLADAATTSPGSQGRYVVGQIDPADRSDEYGNSIVAFGASLVAFGATSIGYSTSTIAFGSTLVGIGTSTIALGTTSVALGTTLIGYGTSTAAFGVTLVAIGSTLFGQGATNISLSTTSVALGTTILAGQVNQGITLVAIGNTSISQSATIVVNVSGIGSTASSFGNSAADPVDLFGYMKRIQENLEGNSQFTKLTGAWSIYNRGSSTLLASKTVSNNSSQVIKT